jgi:predicted metal-dependent hydrolase
MYILLIIIILVILHSKYTQHMLDGNVSSQQLDATKRLSEIKLVAGRLIRHLVTKYPHNTDVFRLTLNLNPDGFFESDRERGSYSINKGEKTGFCLRGSDTESLNYVLLHEMAHSMTRSTGHTEEFTKNLKFLQREAEQIGINARLSTDYCT